MTACFTWKNNVCLKYETAACLIEGVFIYFLCCSFLHSPYFDRKVTEYLWCPFLFLVELKLCVLVKSNCLPFKTIMFAGSNMFQSSILFGWIITVVSGRGLVSEPRYRLYPEKRTRNVAAMIGHQVCWNSFPLELLIGIVFHHGKANQNERVTAKLLGIWSTKSGVVIVIQTFLLPSLLTFGAEGDTLRASCPL